MGKFVTGKQLIQLLKKYKYALIVVCIGLLLMWIPGREAASTRQTQPVETMPAEKDLSAKLEQILSRIQGAGDVKVLLSESRGEKIVYQTDISGTGDNTRIDTVIITDSQREQNGLTQTVLAPEYLGAIIVCQGADRADVRLAIVEAVSDLTGLGADKISVLKMK
jgi:stage III sporulation protein AG